MADADENKNRNKTTTKITGRAGSKKLTSFLAKGHVERGYEKNKLDFEAKVRTNISFRL